MRNALFAGRHIGVVGGSSGLGLQLASAFVRAGASVTLMARDPQRLHKAAASITTVDRQVDGIELDVTQEPTVAAAFSQLLDRHKRLDGLIYATGRSHRGAIDQTTVEDFQTLWDVNFLGAVRCTRIALPALLQNQGHAVYIGSLASKVVAPYLGAYPATKFALQAYVNQLRLEFSPRGLHVLSVCPGPLQREDAGHRYEHLAKGLPEQARRPGGGAKLRLIDGDKLSDRVVHACVQRSVELVVPAKLKWLAALSQFAPQWADWIIRRQTKG